MQEAARPLACLGSSKVGPNERVHPRQFLGGLVQHCLFRFGRLVVLIFCDHLLHPSEAVYHIFSLTVTVVLGAKHRPLYDEGTSVHNNRDGMDEN